MVEQRRADEREAIEAAEREAIVVLPSTTWREIQSRAASVGVVAELLAGGGELRLVADLRGGETAEGARRTVFLTGPDLPALLRPRVDRTVRMARGRVEEVR